MPSSVTGSYSGDADEFTKSLRGQPWLILAAIITIYIVLGVLYESFVHPFTILTTLPSAGIGALLALMLCGMDLSLIGADRHRAADGHRQEERHHDDRLRARGRAHAGPVPARGHHAGVPAALPADHDDDAGGAVRRAAAGAGERHRLGAAGTRWASPSSAACCCSQLLTLYTTPVIYLAMERVRARLAPAAPLRRSTPRPPRLSTGRGRRPAGGVGP